MNETVGGRQEPVLHEYRLMVPVDDTRGNLIKGKGSNEPSIPDGRCTLYNGTTLGYDSPIKTGAFVEVDSRKVNLAQISSVIHVVEQCVHVSA